MTTPRLGLDELIQNQSQPHVPINATIRLIDALLHLAVIDKDLTAPPGAEADGDTYIVGSGATGAWSGHDADVAYFQGTGYVFVDPRIGMWAYVEDEDARYQYTGNTGNGWELIDVGSGGAGAGSMNLVAESVVAGSAATDITISSLNLSTHEHYEIQIEILNATGSVSSISMFFNGDTTATNYDRQQVASFSTTTSSTRVNSAILFSLAASIGASANGKLRLNIDGRARMLYTSGTNNTTSVDMTYGFLAWRTVANVTSITLNSSVASAFAVGSYMRIYRVTS